MRRIIATIAIIVLTCVLGLRLRDLLYRATPTRDRLWLTSHRITRAITHGPAPLLNCDVPKESLVPNSYSIMLKSGHSIQQHKQAVGRLVDLDAAIESVVDDSFPGTGITYFATIEDPSLLDSIRADPGVDVAECDGVEDFSSWRGILVDESGESLQRAL